MTPQPKHRVPWTMIVVTLLVLAYPLSYAPVVRFHKEREAEVWLAARISSDFSFGFVYLPAYRPIDWLVDNTPLHEPLMAWARLWGVEYEFEMGWHLRHLRKVSASNR